MTKAMTALIAFDLIAAGSLHEDSLITIKPATAQRWAGKGTTLNLRGGEQVSVRDLLLGTTTVSANDAAMALAEGCAGFGGGVDRRDERPRGCAGDEGQPLRNAKRVSRSWPNLCDRE